MYLLYDVEGVPFFERELIGLKQRTSTQLTRGVYTEQWGYTINP